MTTDTTQVTHLKVTSDRCYYGLHYIEGAPFRIPFWTIATNIDPVEGVRRLRFADDLVAAWNNRTAAEAASRAREARLLAAVDALGLRQLVAGWNGENRPDGPYEPHPRKLGVTLRTNAGQVYDLDAAAEAARAALASTSEGDG